METVTTWKTYCTEHVTAGFTPGGKVERIPETGIQLVRFLTDHGIVQEGDSILDIGCGNGRLAIGLSLKLDTFIYHGLDVIEPCIDFCTNAFENRPRHKFSHLDVKNPHYWAEGNESPETVIFPVDDKTIDVVIAFSLFTHLDTYNASQHYMDEIIRTLKPMGTLFATWSLTSINSEVALTAEHAIYHINDILKLYERFALWEFVPLDKSGAKNQVGIWARI